MHIRVRELAVLTECREAMLKEIDYRKQLELFASEYVLRKKPKPAVLKEALRLGLVHFVLPKAEQVPDAVNEAVIAKGVDAASMGRSTDGCPGKAASPEGAVQLLDGL